MEQKKMNMISTGTFLPEMDASNKQETLAEKFAAVWEMKNSKAARAGGVSLMALSLAACGSSSTTTTASDETASDETASDETTEEETTEEEVVETTPVVNELALTTSSTDETTGTAGADSITGAVSALSAVRTLQVTDTIDGGDGSDTLELQLDTAFSGFTTGSMTGVETVNITNSGSTARTFDATGVTGATAYNVTGAVDLADLAEIATITAGARTANFDIGYAAAAVEGTADVQTLSITDFGTADDADTDADETSAVAISITAGVETTDLTVTGVNVVDLNGTGSKAITATGTGSLEITDIDSATKTIDASGVAGAVTISDTATPTVMTSIKTGAGDDSVTITDISADVAANATISGGDGDDTLVVKGTATTQLAQTGFETMNFGALGGALNMSMSKSSGVDTLIASKTMNDDVTLSSVGEQAMTINVQGVNSANKAIASDHSGATTVTIDTPAATATATARSANTIDVTTSKSTSVDLDVAAKMDWDGVLTAAKAESVVVSIDGGTTSGAQIVAASATTIEIDSVAAASTLLLNAKSATELTITAAKDLDIGNATLAAVEYLTTAGKGGIDLTGEQLEGIASIDSSTTGNLSFDDLGSATLDNSITATFAGIGDLTIDNTTTNGENITLTVSGGTGNIDFDDVNAGSTANVTITAATAGTFDVDAVTGDDIEIDVSGVVGATTYSGAITTSGNLTVVGSTLQANDLDANKVVVDGTTNVIDFTGGLGIDKITIENDTTTTSVTLKGDLSLGTDVVAINMNANSGNTVDYTVDITGLSNYDGATITLSDDAVDATVKLDSSSTNVANVVYTAQTNKATVTGFDTTVDKVDLDALVGATVATTAVTGALTTTADLVYYLASTTAGDADSAAASAAALTAAATWTDATAVAFVLITDDNSSAIYEISDTVASGDEIATGELTLLGTFDEVLVAGDLTL
jgi:hypothetical protein